MPKLPSGIKIGISNDVVEDMGERPFAYLAEIGTINEIKDIYRFIKIIEFIETSEDYFDKAGFVDQSKNLDEVNALRPILQTYTISDVFSHAVGWTAEDTATFKSWIESEDVRELHRGYFEAIQNQIEGIDDVVDALALTDLDPDQDDTEKYQRAGAYIEAVGRLARKKIN